METDREKLLLASLYASEMGCDEFALSIVMEVAEIDEVTGYFDWGDLYIPNEVLDEAEKRALFMMSGKPGNYSDEE